MMQIRNWFYGALLMGAVSCQPVEPQHEDTLPGTLITLPAFESKYVDPRTVSIWLPENYDSTQQHAVLYMHDGQMLFDSTTTWNKQEWGVDETVTQLIREGRIDPLIVVGIHNNGNLRYAEYFPEAVLDSLPDNVRDQILKEQFRAEPLADEYLMFLTTELKPYIDSHYPTHPDQAHTMVMGSSMGGLISAYAICEYPDVFGGAGCISTHWPLVLPEEPVVGGVDLPGIFLSYLKENLPDPADHQIYFGIGTATLDSFYPPYQVLVDSIMMERNYSTENWMTRVFEGDDHSERSWQKQLPIPITFLAGRRPE